MLVPDLVPRPTAGRTFAMSRRVRLGDVDPTGRCRFDAMARYLQDVARDDSADSGLEGPMNWLVRRTAMVVSQFPVFQELVELTTWCSGIGPRWAERRTSLVGEAGAQVETVTIWVHFDPVTGRPARLVDGFHDRYGEAASGRNANAKLTLPVSPPDGVPRHHWPLRRSDLDVLGHVNNAAYWEALEEVLHRVNGATVLPKMEAIVEHRAAIAPDDRVELCWQYGDPDRGANTGTWWLGPAAVGAFAEIQG